MATYTITTTAAQDKGVQFALDSANASRAAETPPKGAITAQQYISGVADKMLDSWAAHADDTAGGSIKDKFKAATPAQKAAVLAALGG